MRWIWLISIISCAGATASNPNPPPPSGEGPVQYEFMEPRACNGVDVLCVDGAASTSGDGTAASPIRTVQEAIDAAPAGGVVQVAEGTYRQNLTLAEKADLMLLGGLSHDFLERDPYQTVSILQGEGGGSVIHVINGSDFLIEGFRITGGSGTPVNAYTEGGGIFIDPVASRVTIAGNEIDNNVTMGTWEAHGGAIAARGTTTTISFNWIHDNESGRGGGITCDNDTSIEDNVIENNVGVGDHGGGIEASGEVRLLRNVIRGNRIGGDWGWGGGALILGPADATLDGNVVTDNFAPTFGAGMFIDEGARATLTHELYYANQCSPEGGAGLAVDGGGGIGSMVEVWDSTIAWNDCPSTARGGNGAWAMENSRITIYNSIFWKNGGTDFYTEGGGSITASFTLSEDGITGEGNMGGDPMFADPAGGDFHLRSRAGRFDPETYTWVTTDSATSPAIDVGDPSAEYSAEPQPNGSRVNLGHTANSPHASKSE